MDQETRQAYIQAALRYYRILQTRVDPNISEEYNNYSDEKLHDITYLLYRTLKLIIINRMANRYDKYIMNRRMHIPNKTSDKEFYRYMLAIGVDRGFDLRHMKINDLIRVQEIYNLKVKN